MSDPGTVDELFQSDTGDDSSVKSSDIEQFKVEKDRNYRLAFLLKSHRKTLLHTFARGDTFKRFYCKKDAGAECCDLDKNAPEPFWFNIVFIYSTDSDGKVALPISGRVLFFKFKRNKYIAIRDKLAKIREEREDDSIGLHEIDLDVTLDGDEKYQKMAFTHNMKCLLIQFATIQLRKEIIEGNITDEQLPKNIIEAVKKEDEAAKEAEKNEEKFRKRTSFTTDQLRDHAPIFKELLAEAKTILKAVPKFGSFASNLSPNEIRKLYAESDAESGDKKIDPEKMGVSKSDMEDLLG